MGHGLMLLAVAGPTEGYVKEPTKRLASGAWRSFAAAERQTLALAVKLSRKPSAVMDDDVRDLVDMFGRERVVYHIWYTSRVNFATRVADAFRLPLERKNVFAQPKAPAEKDKPRSKQEFERPGRPGGHPGDRADGVVPTIRCHSGGFSWAALQFLLC